MRPFPPAMAASEELERARQLLALRRGAWSRLLGYVPFVEAICDRMRALEAELPEAEIVALCQAVAALRARETRALLEAYTDAREQLAAALHRHRHSSELLRQLAAAVDAVAAGDDAQALAVRQPPRGSAVFCEYRRGLRQARSELEAARQEFVANNLRLVVTLARRYTHPFLTQADLIQEGSLGLLRAVDGFDPERGHRFSTYAAWWIRHAITRALANQGLTIRVPANVLGLRAQLSRIEASFIVEHGQAPSDRELAAELAQPIKAVRNARHAVLGRGSLPGEGENVPDEDALDLDALLDKPVVEAQMLGMVDTLPGIEGPIIRKRFALDGEPAMTLAEIGTLHGLSRERVRQLEKQALGRMRRVGFAAEGRLDFAKAPL